MNLILQAIKSMFRGLATTVARNTEQITEHTASINGLQAVTDENSPFVVTVRYSRDVKDYISSHTNAEIYEAHQNGKRIILNWEDYDTGIIYNYDVIIGISNKSVRFMISLAKSPTYISIGIAEIDNNVFSVGSCRAAVAT